MIIAVIMAGLGPFCNVTGIIFLDLDVLKYVIDEFVTDPHYRSGAVIFGIFWLRISFMFISTIEFSRSGSYFAIGFLLGVDQITKILGKLERVKCTQFPYFYTHLLLASAKCQLWFEWFIQGLYGTSFWGSLFLINILMTCWISLDTMVYVGVAIITVAFIIPHAYVLPIFIESLEMAKDLVRIHRLRLSFLHAKRMKVGSFRMMKMGRAVKPLKVKCGSFQELNHDFIVEHFEKICARLFDIIMLS